MDETSIPYTYAQSKMDDSCANSGNEVVKSVWVLEK